MKSKRFTDKAEAKHFAKEHNGFIEYLVDDKLNTEYIVFYKQ